jgi:hypothetical protein
MRGRFRAAAGPQQPTAQPSKSLAFAIRKCRYASSWRSSVPAVSSISISRNSSESKISPHSRHSTNSVSSCRETIRTLGCLQAVAIVLGTSCTSAIQVGYGLPGPLPPAVPGHGGEGQLPPRRGNSATWAAWWSPGLKGAGFRGTPIWNCDKCSIRQIVTVF